MASPRKLPDRLERAKLRTVSEVNNEMRKTFRWFTNGQISETERKGRMDALKVIRDGLVDTTEKPGDGHSGVDTVNIINIKPGWTVAGIQGCEVHLSPEALQLLRRILPPGSVGPPPSSAPTLPEPIRRLVEESAPAFDGDELA